MNITTNRAALLAAISLCLRVVDEKATMMQLRCVRLIAKGGKLSVAATDLNLSVTSDLVCKGADGGALVAAGRLGEVLAVLTSEDVSLVATTGSLTIKGGKSTQVLSTLHVRDFPEIREAKGKWSPIEPSALAEVLTGCLASICKDESRFFLVGVKIETTGSVIRGVSIDGHWMVIQERPATVRLDHDIIVPKKGVKAIIRAAEAADSAELMLDGFWLHLRTGTCVLSAKCIDHEFPPYHSVIPEHARLVVFDRAPMVAALRRVALASLDIEAKAKAAVRWAKLKIGDGVIALSADNGEGRVASDEQECDGDGDGIEIGVNPRYLIDALDSFSADRVELRYGAPLDPVQVVPAGAVASASVGSIANIMPMRI